MSSSSSARVAPTDRSCRAKAGEYGDLANTSSGLEQRRAFRQLEQRFAVLADNEQWLADNYQNTVHADALAS